MIVDTLIEYEYDLLWKEAIELNEALTPEQKRELYAELKHLKYDRHRWAKIFNNKYRVYIPFEGDTVNRTPNTRVALSIENYGNWKVTDYVAGIATRTIKKEIAVDKLLSKNQDLLEKWKANQSDKDVIAFVEKMGYDIDKGIATKWEEQKQNIGKILKDGVDEGKIRSTILSTYMNDPARASSSTDLVIVISRHPKDIAGMSTDRGWTSCMNLDQGGKKEYVPIEIVQGSIIAYLIKQSDKDIENPIARILIKPFINAKHEIALGVQNKIYGTAPENFSKIVVDWIDKVNESNMLEGVFDLDPKVYNDREHGEDEVTRLEFPKR
jgi:hypothetical protein